jgi:hypothetical protein
MFFAVVGGPIRRNVSVPLLSRYTQKNTQHVFFLEVATAADMPEPLAACLPHQNHVYITTDESFCFCNVKFDEMPCKLDSTENLRSFEKYPTPS